MKLSQRWLLGLAGCLALALCLRLPGLDRRPMHTDEAVHAVKFAELWQTSRYVYDPQEYHGPLLYYATLPVIWLAGARDFAETTEVSYRLVPAIFGAALVLAVVLLADVLGKAATLWAALLLAVSPALVFYSRYYIQESLLAFFSLLLLGGIWRYLRQPGAGWAAFCGTAAGAMHATKETCIISFGCLAGAGLAVGLWHRSSGAGVRWRRLSLHVAMAVAVAVVVSVTFYSGCFQNWRGIADSIRTYATYFQRAAGGVHIWPWDYYLRILAYSHLARGPWWSEGAILALAAVGLLFLARQPGDHGADGRGVQSRSFRRFLAAYAILMTVVYSVIPYKTPWCLTQFLVPLCLLAGYGAARLTRMRRFGVWHATAAGAVLAASAHLCWQSWRASFRFYSDYRNPYVYAQPLRDVLNLAAYVEKLAAVHPAGRRMLVAVVADDPWPLPWYLRRFERVGYWEKMPEGVPAAVWIIAAQRPEDLPPVLAGQYHTSVYGLRPDARLFVLVEPELREAFVQKQAGADQ